MQEQATSLNRTITGNFCFYDILYISSDAITKTKCVGECGCHGVALYIGLRQTNTVYIKIQPRYMERLQSEIRNQVDIAVAKSPQNDPRLDETYAVPLTTRKKPRSDRAHPGLSSNNREGINNLSPRVTFYGEQKLRQNLS
jgi:hypothetical protein